MFFLSGNALAGMLLMTSSAQSATVSRLVCLVLVCMNVCCGWWGIGVGRDVSQLESIHKT